MMDVLVALLRNWRLLRAEEEAGPSFMDDLPYNPFSQSVVCKAWNGFATALLQSTSYATVRLESDLKRLLRLTKHSSSSFPITRFYIKLHTLDNTSPPQDALNAHHRESQGGHSLQAVSAIPPHHPAAHELPPSPRHLSSPRAQL
ncbi:hypothetical protein Ocin01_17974 [Orchesella cincta]|uniref:Uncharacterized protein n=1 Tax=Orchesella cincta TaxID=48709 RepID=A0A1D2M6V9_ORCCI|nr:hypothetical protein Ocin01_17974 [Orchesella cincta]